MHSADKIRPLLDEVRPSEHATAIAVCEAFVAALKKRSPAELKELSGQFSDVGMKHLAKMCRALAERLTVH